MEGCLCVYMCIQVCVPMRMSEIHTESPPFRSSHFFFLKQGLLLDPRLSIVAKLGSHKDPRSLLSQLHQYQSCRHKP